MHVSVDKMENWQVSPVQQKKKKKYEYSVYNLQPITLHSTTAAFHILSSLPIPPKNLKFDYKLLLCVCVWIDVWLTVCKHNFLSASKFKN